MISSGIFILVIFLYQPFYLDQLINPYFKILIFIVFLIFYSRGLPIAIFKKQIIIFFLFFNFLIFQYLLNSFQINEIVILSYYILFILFGFMSYSSNQVKNPLQHISFLKFYIFICYILAILNVLNIIVPHVIVSPINFYFGDKPYVSTIFGLILPRFLLGFDINFYFSYFYEPIYAAFFFYLNTFHISKFVSPKYKFFFIFLNFISGIFTYSSTFFFLVLLELLKKINFKKYYLNFKTIFLYFIASFSLYYFTYTRELILNSFTDRILRIQETLTFLISQDFFTLILGNGYNYQQNLSKAPSNGYLFLIYEIGLLGFIIFLISYFRMFSKNYKFLFFLMLLLEPIYRFPIFIFVLSYLSNQYYEKK